MNLGFVGGLGAAYQGYQQGVQDRENRDQREEDRAFQRQQREALRQQQEFQRSQQQRTLDEQGRADALRERLSKIAPSGSPAEIQTTGPGDAAATDPSSADAVNGADAGFNPTAPAPTQRKRTQYEELNDIARAYHDNGDVAKAIDLRAAAVKLGMDQASKAFWAVRASAAGKSPAQIAQSLKDIVNGDPMPLTVGDVTENADGSVDVAITDHNGATTKQRYKNAQQMLDGLEGYYSPETYRAAIAKQRENDLEIAKQRAINTDKEAAKTVIIPAGGTAMKGGVPVHHNAKEFGPGKGAAGKEPPTLGAQVAKFIQSAQTDGETKFQSPEQYALMQQYGAALAAANPEAGAELLGRVAMTAAARPELVKPKLRFETGRFDNVIKDDVSGKTFTLRQNAADAKSLPKEAQKDAPAQVADMLTWLDQRIPGSSELYQRAAFDKTGKAKTELEASLREQATQTISQRPGFANLSEEEQQKAIEQAFQIVRSVAEHRLAAVSAFGKAPKPGKTLPEVGGLPDPVEGRTTPADVAERKSAAEAALAKRKDAAAAADKQATAAMKQKVDAARSDIAWLLNDPSLASSVGTARAREIVTKYGNLPGVLPDGIRRELNKQL